MRRRMSAMILAIALGAAAPGLARPPKPLMLAGGVVAAPEGYVEMCRRRPALCAVPDTANPPPAMSDQAQLDLLKRINRRVNDRVRPKADTGELWQPAIAEGHGVGDCEDYAIQKRLELIAAGFPAQNLFYAVGYEHRIGLHAVLVARTAGGDLVLDSRTGWLRPWSRTPYVWLTRQSATDPMVWYAAADPLA